MSQTDFDMRCNETTTRQTIARLLNKASGINKEHRRIGRQPFFHPVIVVPENEPDNEVLAFIRDISPNGLGLLHSTPIEPQAVQVLTKLHDEELMALHVRISWCRACGEGYFISGGEFIVSDPQ